MAEGATRRDAPRTLNRIRRGFTPGTWLALGWVGLVVGLALLAPVLPFDVDRIDLRQRAQGPSWGHPLGTSRRGADMMAIVVDGARRSLLVGAGATALAVAVGATAGLVVGYRRGWPDRVATLVADTVVALPGLAVALVGSLVLGPSTVALVVLVGFLLSPGVFRIVRGAARAEATRDYVVAARSVGARTSRILVRELLPNVAVQLVAYGLIVVSLAILIEGALAFLGIGADAESTSWGSLIAAGQGQIQTAPHLALAPAGVLIVTLVAFTVLGEGIQRDGFRPLRLAPTRPPAPPPTPAGTTLAESAETATSRAPTGVGGQPATGEAGLVVGDLNVSYRTPLGPLPVLDGVSFTLPPGRCLAVVGESGSGKSTIIRAVLGLLGPTGGEISGSIRLAGEELVGRHPAELAAVRGKRVALVMQNPSTALNPMRTVGTQLIEPMRRHLGLSAAEARARAVELLGRVHVPEAERRMRAYPFELSGGMAQRVCVALALTGRPEVLLADEPTSSLDTTVSVEILDLLDELRATTGMAMLLVSHSLDVVAQRADDVLVLHAGRVAEVAPVATLFGTPAMPYTRALLAAAPRLANPPHTRLPTLPAGPGPVALQLPGCGFAPRCERADPDCHTSRPPLAPVRAGHEVACWHPVLEDERASLRSSAVPVTQP